MKTSMIGLQRWIVGHPRKRVDGFFTFEGRRLSHDECVKVVNYAVSKGYKTEDDIPDDEVKQLLNWDSVNDCKSNEENQLF